jgi:hypothetical protein
VIKKLELVPVFLRTLRLIDVSIIPVRLHKIIQLNIVPQQAAVESTVIVQFHIVTQQAAVGCKVNIQLDIVAQQVAVV